MYYQDIPYTSDETNNMEFPSFIFSTHTSRFTAIYSVVTEQNAKDEFFSGRHISWKMGQHGVNIPKEYTSIRKKSEYIIDSTKKRTQECTKGSTVSQNINIIVLPRTSRKADDIIRERIYPRISAITDPLYEEAYTWRQAKERMRNGNATPLEKQMLAGGGNPTEIAFHIRKAEYDMMLALIYNEIYGAGILLDPKFEHIASDIQLQDALLSLKDCCTYDEETPEIVTVTSAGKPRGKDISLNLKSAYTRLLGTKNARGRCAVFAASALDAIQIVEMFSNQTTEITVFCMEYMMKEDVENRLGMWYGSKAPRVMYFQEHSTEDRYQTAVIHVQTSVRTAVRTIPRILDEFITPDAAVRLLTDSSLTHTFTINKKDYDEYGNETITPVTIGEKNSRETFDVIIRRLSGHVTSASLENINHLTQTDNCVSYISIECDMKNITSEFPFDSHGIRRSVTSLRDCIEFGTQRTFKRVMEKLWDKFPTIEGRLRKNVEYPCMLKYPCFISSPQRRNIKNPVSFEYVTPRNWMLDPLYSQEYREVIPNEPEKQKNYSEWIHGTREELENYKANCNLDVMKYVSIILSTINSRTNIFRSVVPFISQTQFTNRTIASYIGLDDDEMREIKDVLNRQIKNIEMIHNMEFGIRNKRQPFLINS